MAFGRKYKRAKASFFKKPSGSAMAKLAYYARSHTRRNLARLRRK